MRTINIRGAVRGALSLLAVFSASQVFATDPPDSQTNSQTGYIETVDTTLQTGVYKVRHTTTISSTSKVVILLTAPSTDDMSPRLAISSEGNTWVTWCRNNGTKQVFALRRVLSTGTWSTETMVSTSGESSSEPRVAHDGSKVWFAYEIAATAATSIAATGGDDAGPYPTRTIVGTTTYAGERDLTLSAESGHLWISWVDSTSTVGWVQFDYMTQTWSSARYESYENNGVTAARARIRTTVLGS